MRNVPAAEITSYASATGVCSSDTAAQDTVVGRPLLLSNCHI